nr:hypothetical protein [Tanacetum cinerariifolium]
MSRVGKGFSGVDTPLFEGMLVSQQVHDDIDAATKNEDAAEPTPPSPTPTTTPPPPQQELISSPPQVAPTLPPSPHQCPISQPLSPLTQQPSHTTNISMDLLNTLLEACTTLTKKVENLEQDKIAQALEITKLKQRVRRLEHKRKLKVSGFKRLRKDDEAEPAELKEVIKVATTAKLMIEVVTVAAATTITAAPMPKANQTRRRRGVIIHDPEETATPSVIDEAYARELELELNANINWNEVIEQVKRKEQQDNTVMRYQSLKRKPVTKAQHFNSIMAFLEKGEEASKQGKRKSKSSEQQALKKQRIDEEVEEIKTHLQIVPNDEDDVYTEATPLALKVPVIDYQIHTENNKPYYKIIRADGTHQLYLSFISLLRNFDREDLEMLWKIVPERFISLKPKNLSDDFLINALKTMFEKPNMILLVERRYPLTRFILDQMLNNVRLEVEEESEESLELLRFVRRQQQEGYRPDRRVIKKKFTIFVATNIILNPVVTLELGKSISLTKTVEKEAIRQVHATHARIVTESVPEPARRRPSEQLDADTLRALKESKKTNRRQPGTEGSSKGTGRIPRVIDESKVISDTLSEGTDTKPGVPDEEKDKEKKDNADDDKSINLEITDDEETKMSLYKDDAKKVELPSTSSNLFVSLGFGDQFLKLLSDTSLTGTVKDTTDVEINSLLDMKIQYEVPHIQSPFVFSIHVLVISKPSVLTPIPETPSVAPAITLIPLLSGSTIPPPPPELSKIETPKNYLEQESKKSASEIRKIKKEEVEKQKMPKYTIKSTDKAALKEYNQKSALYQTMNENKSFNRNSCNHALYHSLMEALIKDENAMDKGVVDIVKNHKRQHDDEDDDEDPPVRPNQGNKMKKKRTNESASFKKASTTKETYRVNTPTKDVVHDANQPYDDSTQAKDKDLKKDWFKQPLRPPTPFPEWNKHQVVVE